MYILRLHNQSLDFSSYGSHGQQHDMQIESLVTKCAEGLGFAAAAAKPRPLGEVQNLQPNSRSPRVRCRSWASLEVVRFDGDSRLRRRLWVTISGEDAIELEGEKPQLFMTRVKAHEKAEAKMVTETVALNVGYQYKRQPDYLVEVAIVYQKW